MRNRRWNGCAAPTAFYASLLACTVVMSRGLPFSADPAVPTLLMLRTNSTLEDVTGENYIDEIELLTGAVRQTFALPSAITDTFVHTLTSTRTGMCTSTGSRYEGRLSMSGDRRCVVLACLDAAAGTDVLNPSFTADTTVARVCVSAHTSDEPSVDTHARCSGCFTPDVLPSAATSLDGSQAIIAASRENWARGSRLCGVSLGVLSHTCVWTRNDEGYRALQVARTVNASGELYLTMLSTARTIVTPGASRRGVWSLGAPSPASAWTHTHATLTPVLDTDATLQIANTDLQDFVFESPTAVWLLDSGANRCEPFVRWTLGTLGWNVALRALGPDPCLEMTGMLGRLDDSGTWTLYSTSLQTLYVFRPFQDVRPRVLLSSSPGQVLRGLSWPPLPQGFSSRTPSPTSTMSRTVSSSRRATRTETATRSRTRTVSPAGSSSRSPSASITSTSTFSASESKVPSSTRSRTASASVRASTSWTSTVSRSASRSASATASSSVTSSVRASPSLTPTCTTALPSPSASRTQSRTPSESGTYGSSVSPTSSVSSSATASLSSSQSGSPRASNSRASSPSHSQSISLTPIVLVTVFASPIPPSPMPSSSESRTPLASRSVTASIAGSASIAASQTPSRSVHASVTASSTVSASEAASRTVTRSISASVSRSASITSVHTSTPSLTSSSSQTPSETRTLSPTATFTATWMASSTATSSPSATASASWTAAATTTPSITATLYTTATPAPSLDPFASPSVSSTNMPSPSPSSIVSAFRYGNLLITRIGDGRTALTASAAPLFLDEVDPATKLVVNSFSLPSNGSTACTLPGRPDTAWFGAVYSGGFLTVSKDGRYVSLSCFVADVGDAVGPSRPVLSVIIGVLAQRIELQAGSSFFGGPWFAYSWDGGQVWVGGNGSTPLAFQALNTTEITVLSNNTLLVTYVTEFFEVLYASVHSAAGSGICELGQLANATQSAVCSMLPGLSAIRPVMRPWSFSFQSITRLWVADDSVAGFNVRGLRFSGTTWRPFVPLQLGPASARTLAISGRPEAYAGEFVLYGASSVGLYAAFLSTQPFRVELVVPTQPLSMFVGVAGVPYDPYILARSPSASVAIESISTTTTPSPTPTLSRSASASRTGSWSTMRTIVPSTRATFSAIASHTPSSSPSASASTSPSTYPANAAAWEVVTAFAVTPAILGMDRADALMSVVNTVACRFSEPVHVVVAFAVVASHGSIRRANSTNSSNSQCAQPSSFAVTDLESIDLPAGQSSHVSVASVVLRMWLNDSSNVSTTMALAQQVRSMMTPSLRGESWTPMAYGAVPLHATPIADAVREVVLNGSVPGSMAMRQVIDSLPALAVLSTATNWIADMAESPATVIDTDAVRCSAAVCSFVDAVRVMQLGAPLVRLQAANDMADLLALQTPIPSVVGAIARVDRDVAAIPWWVWLLLAIGVLLLLAALILCCRACWAARKQANDNAADDVSGSNSGKDISGHSFTDISFALHDKARRKLVVSGDSAFMFHRRAVEATSTRRMTQGQHHTKSTSSQPKAVDALTVYSKQPNARKRLVLQDDSTRFSKLAAAPSQRGDGFAPNRRGVTTGKAATRLPMLPADAEAPTEPDEVSTSPIAPDAAARRMRSRIVLPDESVRFSGALRSSSSSRGGDTFSPQKRAAMMVHATQQPPPSSSEAMSQDLPQPAPPSTIATDASSACADEPVQLSPAKFNGLDAATNMPVRGARARVLLPDDSVRFQRLSLHESVRGDNAYSPHKRSIKEPYLQSQAVAAQQPFADSAGIDGAVADSAGADSKVPRSRVLLGDESVRFGGKLRQGSSARGRDAYGAPRHARGTAEDGPALAMSASSVPNNSSESAPSRARILLEDPSVRFRNTLFPDASSRSSGAHAHMRPGHTASSGGAFVTPSFDNALLQIATQAPEASTKPVRRRINLVDESLRFFRMPVPASSRALTPRIHAPTKVREHTVCSPLPGPFVDEPITAAAVPSRPAASPTPPLPRADSSRSRMVFGKTKTRAGMARE